MTTKLLAEIAGQSCLTCKHRSRKFWKEPCNSCAVIDFTLTRTESHWEDNPPPYYCPEHKYNPPLNSGFCFCPRCECPEAFEAERP